jgi:hypothetical protein
MGRIEVDGSDPLLLAEGQQMEVSSRTPEGAPNHCAVCGKRIVIEPSSPFGDAPCPNCGCLLWFISNGQEVRYLPFNDSVKIRERAIRAMAESLGVEEEAVRKNPNIWREMGADSLDLVELIMELEEEGEA